MNKKKLVQKQVESDNEKFVMNYQKCAALMKNHKQLEKKLGD